MHRESESTAPPTPRSSVWIIMVLAAVFGFLAALAIPQFIRSQARREVAQLKAIARATVDAPTTRP